MLYAAAAGLTLALSGGEQAFFESRLRPYAVPPTDRPDVTVTVRTESCPKPPSGTLCGQDGNVRFVRLPDGRMATYGESGLPGCLTGVWVFDNDFRRAEVVLNAAFAHPSLSLTEQAYMYVAQSFGNRLLADGGCVLHSSAMVVDGRGLAFAGISGAGKSTHTALWRQALGERVQMLNDDMPAVRMIDHRPTIYGTPFSGTSPLNTPAQAPLCAIVFVQKAAENEENRIERVSGDRALLWLREVLPLPEYLPELSARGLDMLAALAQSVPLYRLRCDRSEAAFDTAYRVLMKDGEAGRKA